MKTAITLCSAALLGLGIIGCSDAGYGPSSTDSSGAYGTPSTAGNTIPGSENTSTNTPAATPRQPNASSATPGVNPSEGVSNGPTVNTGQGNINPQDSVAPTK